MRVCWLVVFYRQGKINTEDEEEEEEEKEEEWGVALGEKVL